ncbi:hypothetical protein C8J57DRAFT_1246901 [Mycena rebaudengoi]|nr:hypothetical protein C8J57DRAFT_1246901 [Mycena rebaudengoi]
MVWPWLGLKAMALARLCLALARKNPRPGQRFSQIWDEYSTISEAMAFGLALAWDIPRPGQKPTQAKLLAWLWPWYQSQKALAFWPEAKARPSLRRKVVHIKP